MGNNENGISHGVFDYQLVFRIAVSFSQLAVHFILTDECLASAIDVCGVNEDAILRATNLYLGVVTTQSRSSAAPQILHFHHPPTTYSSSIKDPRGRPFIKKKRRKKKIDRKITTSLHFHQPHGSPLDGRSPVTWTRATTKDWRPMVIEPTAASTHSHLSFASATQEP